MKITNDYHEHIRTDISQLLPEQGGKVLEIGCGSGNTLLWLKDHKKYVWAGGVELHSEAAARALHKIDAVYEGNIEVMELPISPLSLDLILCLDVLEHLIDPWSTVARLQKLLKPGGTIIISVPNVRSRKVLIPLLFKGRWNYVDSGILDKTHLRFFTRESAVSMLEAAGLVVDKVLISGGIARGMMGRILPALLPEGIRSLYTTQYLIKGSKCR